MIKISEKYQHSLLVHVYDYSHTYARNIIKKLIGLKLTDIISKDKPVCFTNYDLRTTMANDSETIDTIPENMTTVGNHDDLGSVYYEDTVPSVIAFNSCGQGLSLDSIKIHETVADTLKRCTSTLAQSMLYVPTDFTYEQFRFHYEDSYELKYEDINDIRLGDKSWERSEIHVPRAIIVALKKYLNTNLDDDNIEIIQTALANALAYTIVNGLAHISERERSVSDMLDQLTSLHMDPDWEGKNDIYKCSIPALMVKARVDIISSIMRLGYVIDSEYEYGLDKTGVITEYLKDRQGALKIKGPNTPDEPYDVTTILLTIDKLVGGITRVGMDAKLYRKYSEYAYKLFFTTIKGLASGIGMYLGTAVIRNATPVKSVRDQMLATINADSGNLLYDNIMSIYKKIIMTQGLSTTYSFYHTISDIKEFFDKIFYDKQFVQDIYDDYLGKKGGDELAQTINLRTRSDWRDKAYMSTEAVGDLGYDLVLFNDAKTIVEMEQGPIANAVCRHELSRTIALAKATQADWDQYDTDIARGHISKSQSFVKGLTELSDKL